MKAHSLERPTDFSPNVSENGLVQAHSFQILGEKFVHISNISAVTDPILTTLFVPNFLGALTFLAKILFDSKKFLKRELFSDPQFFLNICFDQ